MRVRLKKKETEKRRSGVDVDDNGTSLVRLINSPCFLCWVKNANNKKCCSSRWFWSWCVLIVKVCACCMEIFYRSSTSAGFEGIFYPKKLLVLPSVHVTLHSFQSVQMYPLDHFLPVFLLALTYEYTRAVDASGTFFMISMYIQYRLIHFIIISFTFISLFSQLKKVDIDPILFHSPSWVFNSSRVCVCSCPIKSF